MSTHIPPDVDRDLVDDVAVELFVAGRPVGRDLTLAERRAVVRELHRRGLGRNMIALEVGLNIRQVRAYLGDGDAR